MSAKEFIEVKGVKIPIILEKSNLIPMSEVSIYVSGLGNLNAKNKGEGELLNELLNRGSKNLGNLGFDAKLQENALRFSVDSGFERTKFTMSFLNEKIDSAFNLLYEVLYSPNFTQEELLKAKTALSSQIAANKNDFDFIASELLESTLFEGSLIAKFSNLEVADVKKVKLQNIESNYKKALILENIVIAISGDFNKEIFKKLESLLGDLPSANKYQPLKIEARKNPKIVESKHDTQQAYIYFGSPFYIKNLKKEAHLIQTMFFILGSSGFGSRLLEEIRVKRGLAYGASINARILSVATSTSGYLQTKLESKNEAIKVVKEVINNFIKNGATQSELDSAKRFMLGSEPLKNETPNQRLNQKITNYFRGLDLDFNTLESIKTLELKELNKYIKSHTELKDLTFAIVRD